MRASPGMKKHVPSWLVTVAMTLIVVGVPRPAAAQASLEQILTSVIQQFQTGQLNPNWYGFQLWQTIAAQTWNTGVYPQLVNLGPVESVQVLDQIQLPAGPVYRMMAEHRNGASYWDLGISYWTGRIEYGNFYVGSSPAPLPTEAPTPTGPSPRPNPGGQDHPGCQKFPNMC